MHERWTSRIVLDPNTEVHQVLQRHDSGLPGRVVELIEGRHSLTFLARTVSGAFDVDRCDYLLRDAHATGVGYGSFDLDWLLRSLRFGNPDGPDQAPPLAIDGAKGLPAVESFTLARLFMFQQVYFHKASRASEWMLTRILARVRQLLLAGHHLSHVPKAVESIVTTADACLMDYLALDDFSLWASLRAWRDSSDEVLSDLCRRIYSRKL